MSTASSLDVIVFVGPTLPIDDAAELLSATYLPPAAQGDVYRAALRKPWGIAIIDGYFERVPAVWHKEILWALSRGIHVFGASSMGALRAVELEPFGMVGVGKIFDAYRSGTWLDDDEVTIVHADESHAYRPLSIALADIRATIARACEQDVVSAETGERLVRLAKGLYYPDRSYPRLWAEARTAALPPQELAQLERWTTQHQVHQKASDARELLAYVTAFRREHPGPKAVGFHFEHTDAFEQLIKTEGAQSSDVTSDRAVLDELRLEPELFSEVAERAFLRVLCAQAAERFGVEADESAYRREVESYRRELALWDGATTEAFLARQDLTRDELEELLRANVRAQRLRAAIHCDVERAMVGVLKLEGSFEPLARAARRKHAWLEAHGHDHPNRDALDEVATVRWYVERIARRANRVRDPQRLLDRLQFMDSYELLAAARRQYLYETTHQTHDSEEVTDEETHVHRRLEAGVAE